MNFQKSTNNEDGFVLVVALMVMAILSLVGIAGLNTSMFEVQIAGNDWNAKRTFYKADGGISFGAELLEQNFNCSLGFTGTGVIQNIMDVNNKTFSDNTQLTADTIKAKLNDPTANYDAAYPTATIGVLPTQDVGYLYFGGYASMLPGGSLQMARLPATVCHRHPREAACPTSAA